MNLESPLVHTGKRLDGGVACHGQQLFAHPPMHSHPKVRGGTMHRAVMPQSQASAAGNAVEYRVVLV